VFCPSFWSPTAGGETRIAGGQSINIQGWSIETSAGVWTVCDGASDAGIALVNNASAGQWLPKVTATLTANTTYRARMTFIVSATSVNIPRNTAQAGVSAAGGQERTEGSTSTRFARLSTTGANLSNSGGVFYKPAMMIALGGNGSPSVLVLGDSIGYGVSGTIAQATWTARNEFGYITTALDDNTSTARLAYHNMCIPGQRPCGVAGWDVAANWQGKLDALLAVNTEYGALPFDIIINQHITNAVPYSNDGGDLKIGMGRYFGILQTNFPSKPIYQVECLPAVASTDGYQTLANQSAQTGYAFPTANLGHAWTFNADVGGADGLGDPAAYYRANNFIAGSIAPWRLSSADLANDRDLFAIRPFTTTLTSAYVSGNSIVCADAPTVGEIINMQQDAGGFGGLRVVLTVTGTGPFTVGLSGSAGTAAAIGRTVKATATDTIHPSPILHNGVLRTSLINWKTSMGYV
jgi:hypothetical protein